MKFSELRRLQLTDAARHVLMADARTMDSAEALGFLVSQLTHVESEVYKKARQSTQYKEFVPISFEAGEHATSITYEMFDYAGRGQRSTGRSKAINKVDVAYARKDHPVYPGNIGYDYTTEELRQSAFLRKPLNTSRADAAMDAWDRHMNDVALNGEDDLHGLYNSPYVPVANATKGDWLKLGQAGGVTMATILKDINDSIVAHWKQTAYTDMPTTVLLPPEHLAILASIPRSDASDKTVLEYIKDNNIAKLERGVDLQFRAAFGLEKAGVGGKARMLVYVKNPNKLVMHIPMALKFLPPQAQGLMFEIPGEYKYSGVEWRYPKSGLYVDGI